MIFWNFKTPITLFFYLIWNFCEYFKLSLGSFAPKVFGLAMGVKGKRKR